MELAETAGLDGVPLRVVGAGHLAVIALSVGRAKDFARVLVLRESGSVTRGELELLASWQPTRQALTWPEKVRMGEADPRHDPQAGWSGSRRSAPA